MRSPLRLAVLLAVVGAGALVLALGQAWAEVPSDPGLTITPFTERVPGKDLAPVALALGYVGLAGVAALVATRGWGRVLVGVLVLAAGIGALVDVVPLGFGDGLTSRAQEQASVCDGGGCASDRVVPPAFSGWPWVASGGAVLLVLGGGLTAVRGRSWSTLGTSYQAPGGQAPAPGAQETAPAGDKAVWDALDRGDDPTV